MTPASWMTALTLLAATGCASVERAPAEAGTPPQATSAAEPAPVPEAPTAAVADARRDPPVEAQPVPAETPSAAPAAPESAPPPAPPAQPAVVPAQRAPARSATVPSPVAAGKPAAVTQSTASRSAASAAPAPRASAPAPSSSTGPSAANAHPVEKESSAAGSSKSAGAQPLNLASLEQRLRDTSAIGVMTKITIKNQVDELLDRFKAYHDGRDKTPIAQLRQPYDSLILKVLALLQDKDPSLASSIAASREAIWAVLTDRNRFSNL